MRPFDVVFVAVCRLHSLPDLELIEGIARELTGRSLSRTRTGHLANGRLKTGRVPALSAILAHTPDPREARERGYRGLALLLLVVVGLLAFGEEIRCHISVEVAFERATDDISVASFRPLAQRAQAGAH